MKTTLVKRIGALVLTGATVAMASANVMAETPASATGQASQATTDRALATMDVDKIEGKDLFDSTGQQLGDVDEVVVNKANQSLAVIGLEDSDKEVAVPLSRLTLSSDGKNLTTKLTKAELLAMPDYDPMDMESIDE